MGNISSVSAAESSIKRPEEGILWIVYASYDPHCVQVLTNVLTRQKQGFPCRVVGVDATRNRKLAESIGDHVYPTICFESSNGKRTDYSGDFTPDALHGFVIRCIGATPL